MSMVDNILKELDFLKHKVLLELGVNDYVTEEHKFNRTQSTINQYFSEFQRSINSLDHKITSSPLKEVENTTPKLVSPTSHKSPASLISSTRSSTQEHTNVEDRTFATRNSRSTPSSPSYYDDDIIDPIRSIPKKKRTITDAADDEFSPVDLTGESTHNSVNKGNW